MLKFTSVQSVHEDASVHPTATIIGACVVGPYTTIGPGAVIGANGLGYTLDEHSHLWHAKTQDEWVFIFSAVSIGAGTIIARGSYRPTVIGHGSKLDAGVFVAHNSIVGEHCLLVAGAVICGSVELGTGVIVGANATVKEHVTVGANAIIGCGAVVLTDVPADQVWAGNPARYLRDRLPGEAI